MADIRIKDLPLATGPTSPTGTDAIAIDGLTTRKTTISALGDVAIPVASQAEAEAGSNASKRMTPLTTKQSIASEVGVTLASAAQGGLANSALQPGDVGSAAYQDTTAFATSSQGTKADSSLQGLDASQYGLLPSNTAAQNSAALTIIEALPGNSPIYVPQGLYETTKGFYDLINKRYFGPGRLKLDGHAQAPNRKFFTSPQPNMPANRTQAFDALGDVHYPSYTFVGAGANEVPTPGVYTNYYQYCGRIHIHDFSGGFNTPLDDHVQRSGHFGSADFFYHGGLGDGAARTLFASVSSTKPLLTHWLAGSAIIGDNGGIGADAGAGVVYLNREEIILSDSNNPATGIYAVANMIRTNGTATASQIWAGHRIQSGGAVAVDVAYPPAGLFKNILSTVAAQLGSNGAAITLANDHYVYFGCTPAPDVKGLVFNCNLSSLKMGFNTTTSRLELNGQDVTTSGKVALTMTAPWAATVPDFSVPKYRKHMGRVYLDGQAKGGLNFAVVGNLPAGFRPATKRAFTTLSPYGITTVQVWPDGNVVSQTVATFSSENYIGLDGIQFDVEV